MRSIARGSAVLVAGQYGAAALGLAATVMAARLLGPKDFGFVALVIAYPELIQSAFALKSSSVTTRYLVLMRSERRVDDLGAVCKLGYGVDVGAALATLAVVTVTAGVAADLLYGVSDATRLSRMTILYALVLPVMALNPTSVAVLTVTGRFGWMAAVHVAESGLRLSLIVVLMGFDFGVGGVVMAIALASAGAAIARMAMAARDLGREGVGHWLRIPVTRVRWLWREFTALLGWNYLMVTLSGIMGQLPVLWLGHIRGPVDAGFFRLATSIVTTAQYAEAALGRVVTPELVVALDREARQDLRARALRLTVGLGLPLAGTIAMGVVLLPWVIPLAFGSRFADSVPSMQVMVGSAMVSAVLFWANPVHYAAGRIGLMARLYGATVAVSLAAAWLVIGRYGLMGMAVVFAASRVAFTLALLGGAAAIAEERGADHGNAAGRRVRPSSRDPAGFPTDTGWRRG